MAQLSSRWVKGLVLLISVVLVSTLLNAGRPASAEDLAADRVTVVTDLLNGGPSVRRAAETALLGSDDDVRAYVDGGRAAAADADARAAAHVLAGMDGPTTRTVATQVLSGSAADVRAFVEGGYRSSWDADERVRAYRVLEAGGPKVKEAAQKALAGTKDELSQFLAKGRDEAQFADDRLAATRMLTGGAGNSGPVMDAAAQQALAGSREELAEFLASGQYVARARDEELASIGKLTQQAKEAGELTSRETLLATEASTRAMNAALEAKKSAEEAARESAAAGGSAQKASAAAGRAADAAEGAAEAAKDAIGASNAAMRAARVAADAARKATTAASLTAQAASRAQRAAAAARTDASKASAARQAAEAARNAAAKARELQQVKAERDRALAQAKLALDASKSASGNANDAAAAADQAGSQAGVSQAQAQRARDAAAKARRAAAAAARAAERALTLAQAAAKASDEAFRFAAQAADHAERSAQAAEDAANHAGDASRAAAESSRHAAAAVEAANVAVTAANQAVELEKLARTEDAARLQEATDQGILAAQDALAEERAATVAAGELAVWSRNLQWDTAEEDRVPATTRALLTEATAPGAPAAVVLAKGRAAAAALLGTGGQWTRGAAAEALAGGEVELRSWLTEGRAYAVGQDDRARAWNLVDTLPDGPEKTAAQTALNGDDAAVQQFLRNRTYTGKTAKDRQAVYAILNANPGPNVTAAANAALAGTPAQVHQFLRTGQHTARTADERLEVYRVMEAGGPQVKAAAQVALAGPGSHITYFLQVSRYQAAQRDGEQATHVAAVRALIEQAQQYAKTAVSDAAEANRVAAVANKWADKAAEYARQASEAATAASDFAAKARQSALAAKQSADQAAQSAVTARNAANSAQNSANRAAGSAATAGAAARRAAADAADAYQAKREAMLAAKAAGADAIAANLAAKEAGAIYATRLKEWEKRRRSTEAGTADSGNGTALDQHKTWGCLQSASVSAECVTVYKDFGKALLNPAKCSAPANNGTAGCSMLNDLKQFVENNPDLLIDMLQFVLGMCGLIPGVGEVCDAADAAISFKRGDWVGGLLSMGAAIPGIGYLAAGAKGIKNADKLRDIMKVVDTLATVCRRSSFVRGTRVLLADGTSKPIEQVDQRDDVVSTDPASGVTAVRSVAATISTSGAKVLIDIEVDVDGDAGTATAVITATYNHPFWVTDVRDWRDAGTLEPGQHLRRPDGKVVAVDSVTRRPAQTRVYNLGVPGFQTYYVVAGGIPVLVHNCGGFKNPVSADEVNELNRSFGGQFVINGSFDNTMINASYYNSFFDKAAVVIRDITGSHMFNDGNHRTTQAVVELLMQRNNVVSGPTSDELRWIIDKVAKRELKTVEEISAALRGY